MNELIYNDSKEYSIVEEGCYIEDDTPYNYVIASIHGMWPCAYVELPTDHPYYDKDYDDMDIMCHGGLTFKGVLPNKEGMFIGWDYAHLGDYTHHEKLNLRGSALKKWDVPEIMVDIRNVISQLSESCTQT